MEALLAIALLVLLIIMASGNSRLLSQLRELTGEVINIRHDLNQRSRLAEIKGVPETAPPKPRPEPVFSDLTTWAPKPVPVVEEPLPTTPETEPEPSKPEPEPIPEDLLQPEPAPAAAQESEPTLEPEPEPLLQVEPIGEEQTATAAASSPGEPVVVFPRSQPSTPPVQERPGFFERNPDLEKFIGENLISKIGIAILVIAIGFFVKYAIDREWIGPAGRVGIGVLCGGILIGLAHRLQRAYKAFSSVLVGGGLAVLYFSIALAYKDYALFSQPVAFVIMVVITIFAILLSLLYDRQEVAIIAMAGGFAVPFMVSNGSGNYVTLFSYLLLLNAGLLAIAYRKAWRLLNFIAFAATVLLYAGWLTTLPPETPHATYVGGLLFATAFYILFLAVNLAHNIRERKKFIASDFGILLASNALYFSAGLYLLYTADAASFKGLFCAALGVLNFVLTFLLLRRRNIDKSILYLLVGITLTFISLTAPLQLNGHYITLFWAAETVVLLWLRQKSGIRLLQWGALLVWACSLISLFMDWSNVYGTTRSAPDLLPVMLNGGFITTVFVASANAALARLLRNTNTTLAGYEPSFLRRALGGLALILLYVAGAIELIYQFNTRYPDISLSVHYIYLYSAAFLLMLWLLVRRGWLRLPEVLCLTAMLGSLLFYLVAAPLAYGLQEGMLATGEHGAHFNAHWAGAILTALIFYQLITRLRRHENSAEYGTALTWIASAFAVSFVSMELNLLTNALFYAPERSLATIGDNYIRVGLPIIWGLCSFALMWLGMRHKYRPLRIVSLSLFTITLLKLFLFDIRQLSPGGKIAAFFSLGVLLLIVSFMYQRLKRLIIEDERKDETAQ